MTGYIYKISCPRSPKVYVGSAINPQKRWATHLRLLRLGKHHSPHLQRAFNKHGESEFAFNVAEQIEDRLFLLAREQFWIWRYAGKLYNSSPTAGSPLGVKHSKETRLKHSNRMLGNTIRRGATMPPTAKQQIADSLAGNKRRGGIPHSAEDKAKISVGLKRAYREGRRMSPDKAVSVQNITKWNEAEKQRKASLSFAKQEVESAA